MEYTMTTPLISEKTALDLLCGAASYCGYWGFLGDIPNKPENGYEPKSQVCIDEEKRDKEFYDGLGKEREGRMIDCYEYKIWEAVMGHDAKIPVHDAEDEDEILGYITKESIFKAGFLMAQNQPSHFADAMGDHDAITSDVWFQYVVMEDVVYG